MQLPFSFSENYRAHVIVGLLIMNQFFVCEALFGSMRLPKFILSFMFRMPFLLELLLKSMYRFRSPPRQSLQMGRFNSIHLSKRIVYDNSINLEKVRFIQQFQLQKLPIQCRISVHLDCFQNNCQTIWRVGRLYSYACL